MALSHERIAAALFPKARARILALFFGREGGSLYLRQVVDRTGLGVGSVQRELARLAAAGILRRTVVERNVFFRAERSCPVFRELGGIAAKALGPRRRPPPRPGSRRR